MNIRIDGQPDDLALFVAPPAPTDHKYLRGVLGIISGSETYPGAAALSVSAAIHTGVGMVRFLSTPTVLSVVLQHRPEAVPILHVRPDQLPAAWLLGSGVSDGPESRARHQQMREALAQRLPTVIDAGALGLLAYADVRARLHDQVILTPHAGEMARLASMLGRDISTEDIRNHPAELAFEAAKVFGVTFVLKGAVTYVADQDGNRAQLTGAPSWLASAGTGDVLAGIAGGLLAINRERASAFEIARAAVALHGLAAHRASAGGPIAALELAGAIPGVIADILADADADGAPSGDEIPADD